MKLTYFGLFLISIFSLSIATLNAQYEIEWQNNFGGSDADNPRAILKTEDGGFVILSRSFSSDGDISENNGNSDAWIFKIDAEANLLWEKSFGSSYNENPVAMVQGTNGEIVILCEAIASQNDDIFLGGNDFWLFKIDANGNLISEQNYGTTYTERPKAMSKTPDGGYILVGESYTMVNDIEPVLGLSDFTAMKIDQSGELVWSKIYGGSQEDVPQAIIPAVDGGYLIGGYSESDDIDVTSNAGNSDQWLIKISEQGDLEWTQVYGIPWPEEIVTMVATNANDGYLLLDYDFNLRKITLTGEEIWNIYYGGSEQERPHSILAVGDGYIMAGESGSSDGDVSGNNGDDDMWVIKVDEDGNVVCEQNFGGSLRDYAKSIIPSGEQDSYIVIGQSASNDQDIPNNYGSHDVCVLKIKDLCNQPVLAFGPDEIDFGTKAIDQFPYTPEVLMINNTIDQVVTIDDFEIADEHFNIEVENYTLQGLESVLVQIYFTPSAEGTFESQLILKNEQGDVSVPLRGTATSPTALNEISNNDFLVYPNPSTGLFRLQSMNDPSFAYEILNVAGKILRKENQINGSSWVDLRSEEAGVYFVKFYTEQGIQIKKLMIY